MTVGTAHVHWAACGGLACACSKLRRKQAWGGDCFRVDSGVHPVRGFVAQRGWGANGAEARSGDASVSARVGAAGCFFACCLLGGGWREAGMRPLVGGSPFLVCLLGLSADVDLGGLREGRTTRDARSSRRLLGLLLEARHRRAVVLVRGHEALADEESDRGEDKDAHDADDDDDGGARESAVAPP